MRCLALFGALAALMLSVAACGASAPDIEGVASAAANVEKAKTMRFSFETELSGDQAFSGQGAIDLGHKRMHVTSAQAGLSAVQGLEMSFEAIFIGRTVYMKVPWLFPRVEKPWVKIEDAGAGVFDGQFPDPSEALKMLRAAGEFEQVGREDVRGVGTTHYRGKLTTESGLAPEGSLVDAWVDGGGYLRRFQFHDGSDTGTIEFYDFGADLDIQPPLASEVAAFDPQAACEEQEDTYTVCIEVKSIGKGDGK